MNPLWTGAALRFRPLPDAAVTLLLYVGVTLVASSKDRLTGELLFPLFAALLFPLPRHAFARFARTEATEWLMGMGLRRDSLAFRYAFDLLWWSLVHALGGTLLLASAPALRAISPARWQGSERIITLFAGVFLIQLTVRSAFGILAHLDRSTALPARMRDALGNSASFWPTVGWFAVATLIIITLVSIPILLVVTTHSIYWLAVPAALYLRLAHLMAGSSEFVRRSSPPVDEWGFRIEVRPAAPPRQFFGGLAADRGASAPLQGLLWYGLGRGMKWFALALGLPVLGSALYWLLSPSFDRERPEIFLWFSTGIFLLFFIIAGQKIFAWAQSDDGVEYLFMRGVTLRTMDRVRMTYAGLIVLATVGYMALIHRRILGDRDSFPWSAWAVVLYVGAALLFECNRGLLPGRLLGMATFADVGRALRRGWWLFWIAAGMTGVRLIGEKSAVWLGLGLLLFVPALLGWLRSFVPLLVRQAR